MSSQKKNVKFWRFLRMASFLVLVVLSQQLSVNAQSKYIKICQEAIDLEKDASIDQALLKYQEAIIMKTDEWSGYSHRAIAYYHARRYEEAITDVSLAITLHPKTAYNYLIRANCYMAKGDFKQSIPDYAKGIALMKDDSYNEYAAYFNRGRAYYEIEEYGKAVVDFTKAIQMSYKEATAATNNLFNWRGMAYLKAGKYTEAIMDFNQCLLANPQNTTVLLYQGIAYIKTENLTAANEIVDKILELEPALQLCFTDNHKLDIFDLEKRRQITASLLEMGKLSMKDYEEMPSQGMAKISLENAFNYLDSAWKYAPAVISSDREIRDTIFKRISRVYTLMKQKPDLPELARKYMVQAIQATEEKHYDVSLRYWNKAVAIAPWYPLSYYNRALLWGIMGNYRGAISDMERYVKLAPDAPDARAAKDKIYEWEAKIPGGAGQATNLSLYSFHAYIMKEQYNPGNYYFAIAAGGSWGVQILKNETMAAFWDSRYPAKEFIARDPFLWAFDAEALIKPVKWIALGGFYKGLVGNGIQGKSAETHPDLVVPTKQFGGLARLYLQNGNAYDEIDFYLQVGFGKSRLDGYYTWWGSNSLYVAHPDNRDINSVAPFRSYGFGFGGKINKHGYMNFCFDYVHVKFKEINYELDEESISGEPQSGIWQSDGSNVELNYSGLLMKLTFGVAF